VGQGDTIRAVAAQLKSEGWSVHFVCVPNTPHVGVIPIPCNGASAKQRYPDVLASNDRTTKFVEVEPGLNENSATDLETRFSEMLAALNDPPTWQLWRDHVVATSKKPMPQTFLPECDLVICTKGGLSPTLVTRLQQKGIRVLPTSKYTP
jgi:hypothetical protein